jgi:hypothetical protein
LTGLPEGELTVVPLLAHAAIERIVKAGGVAKRELTAGGERGSKAGRDQDGYGNERDKHGYLRGCLGVPGVLTHGIRPFCRFEWAWRFNGGGIFE